MGREAIGIVCISLVIGLLTVGLLIGARTGKEVSLISSTVPPRLDRSVGSKPAFSVGLVSGRDLEELCLRFALMFEADPEAWIGSGRIWIEEADLGKRTGLVPVDLWLERASEEDFEMSPQTGSVVVNGTEYDAYVYDFRDLLSDAKSMGVYAALFRNGNLSKVYWGYGDFFVQPNVTISSLKVEVGEGVEIYSKDPRGDEKSIHLLPGKGELMLGSMREDEQILVSMLLDGHLLPMARSWLWTCMAVADGRPEDLWIFSTL